MRLSGRRHGVAPWASVKLPLRPAYPSKARACPWWATSWAKVQQAQVCPKAFPSREAQARAYQEASQPNPRLRSPSKARAHPWWSTSWAKARQVQAYPRPRSPSKARACPWWSPSFGGFGRTFRVQSVQPPFGRPFLGRFVDIRPACTVGSRPLRPRLTLCCTDRGRCRPEHPEHEHHRSANAVERSANAIRPPSDEPEHGTDGHQTERNAPEHTADGRKRHDSAPERSANEPEHTADAPEHDAQCAKNADFIDADPVHGHQTERNEPEYPADGRKRHDSALEHPANAAERSANAVSTPADEPEHDAQCAKIADFIDADPACGHQTERNAVERSTNAVSPLADAGEHADRGRKRHDSAPEHPANAVSTPADECPDPAYDPDAGQRLLDTAAHRRAVRAEREACCGALRHLAHCCVAF